MTTAAPNAASQQGAGTIDWEDLLMAIDDGKVVPVVGRDLLVVPDAEGPALVYRRLALGLADALSVPREDLPAEPEIEDVAHRFLASRRGEWDALYTRLRALLDKLPRVVPDPLRKLATITPISLYVSTTFDDLLARALAGAGRVVDPRHYRPREELLDLPAAMAARAAPASDRAMVFHVLGRPSTDPGSFAVTEEDTLEFVHELQAKLDPAEGELKNLGLLLQRRHLLFLGCDFPDWLMRFFIRTLRGERFHTERPTSRARVADRRAPRESRLVTFLEQYGTHVYQGNPVDFVDELSRRWAERHAAARAQLPARGAAPDTTLVLLGCAAEDRPAAQAVADKLAQWSIGCAILPLRGGDDVALRARLADASAYVAFLSDGALGPAPERDEALLATFRAVDARNRTGDRGPLSTLAITLDDAAVKKHRAQRTWGEWMRLARRLHRPSADDVAWRIADGLFDARRLGGRLPVRVYLGYADVDRPWREQLETHLASAVARSTWISVWHRDLIASGGDVKQWEAEVDRADVVVLLVSVKLLVDRVDEIDRALARWQEAKAAVIPVLVRSCEWQETLGALAPLPADQTYIAAARDPDAAFREVVQALLLATFDFVLGAPGSAFGRVSKP